MGKALASPRSDISKYAPKIPPSHPGQPHQDVIGWRK